jgi:hypothetical protein
MNKTCINCSNNFEITDDDLKFYEKISTIIAGKKFNIPPPTLCPECRQQRRLAICNESHLYQDECDMCKKRTLSEYPPHLNKTVYCRDCWHSDQWDARDYGKEVDFSRPIFEQAAELKNVVPSLALNAQGTCINSDYIHYAGSCKNCYLIMHADFCEDCYYGYGFKNDVFCVDGFYNLHCELCYECIDCHKCYGLKYSQDCLNCHSSQFLRDCIGCKNCFLCVGLREKEYCFENKQLTREEYEQKVKEFDLGSYAQCQNLKERLKELEKKHIFKEYQGHNLQDCSGDHLNNCKEAKNCFDCEDVETAKYCYQVVLGAKNIYDIYQYGTNLQESYECAISGENSYHLLFCNNCHLSSADLIYCWYMEVSKNCFGCANMARQSYCILNKQYSKEEYEALVPKIIEHMKTTGEWGEFFPMSISPFGYNKSSAQMYFPLTKEQVLQKGLKWDDYEAPIQDIDKVVEAKDIPDKIDDIPDNALNFALKCEVTGKLFKITPQELNFYRKHRIPLPRRAPNQRHLDRFEQRNPRKFWDRQCSKCEKSLQTTYSPDKSAKVYCEKCYLEEAY